MGELRTAKCGVFKGYLLGLALCLVGPAAKGSLPPPPTSHYERGPLKSRVIVFVHGIFGDATGTWTSAEGVYWPKLLLSDSAFDDSDVYVANYDSPLRGNTMTVDEIAASLNSSLTADGVFEKHREVVFVCHSLGGIVIQQLLLTFRSYADKVPLVYFFSVPEEGSQVAVLGKWFSSDPLLEALFHGDENRYLLALENQWKAAHFKIHRFCAYEKKALKGAVLVVDRLSATRNCDDPAIPINENHFGIVKPNSVRHASYIALRNAILANPLPPLPRTGGPSSSSDEPSERATLRVIDVKASMEGMAFDATISVQNVGKYIALPLSIVRAAVKQSPPLFFHEDALFDGAPDLYHQRKTNRTPDPNWQKGGIIATRPWYPGDIKSFTVHTNISGLTPIEEQIAAFESGKEGWYVLTRAFFKDKLGKVPHRDFCMFFSTKIPNGERCWKHND
ncbi:MAG: alpha/beta fold hydrolase [Candidatus Sulfotelmatobacter sp.]